MPNYPQHTSSFDDRLNQWIASQSLWFQLRHSSGRSLAAKLAARMMSLGLRLLVLLAVTAVGVGVYLVKRVETKAFLANLHGAAGGALNAEKAKVQGFQRLKNQAYIHVLTADGGRNSFYRFVELRGIRYRMGLLDGLMGTWEAGPVTVNTARIELKAGAEDAAEAKASLDCLFRQDERFQFDHVEILNADLVWGYSDRTRGYVSDTQLICQRNKDGWNLQFRGGVFGQNWLRNLEIAELVVQVTADGLVIEKAQFRQGKDGRASLLQGKVTGGERPQLSGRVSFKSLDLGQILPTEAAPFVDGTISGEVTLGGSTNTQGGVEFQGEVMIGEGDRISVRDRLPLFRALTVVDGFNSYKKVDFTSGGFRMKSGGGGVELEGVKMEAGDLLSIRGSLRARPPTKEEVNRALAEGPQAAEWSFFAAVAASEVGSGVRDAGEEFTLKRAAEAAKVKAKEEGENRSSGPGSGGLAVDGLNTLVQEGLRERYARMPRYEGLFQITLPRDAFEQARGLREAYPVDPDSGRIPLEVLLKGSLFELTLSQAEEIYRKGRRFD